MVDNNPTQAKQNIEWRTGVNTTSNDPKSDSTLSHPQFAARESSDKTETPDGICAQFERST
jgi:hypothetical protein